MKYDSIVCGAGPSGISAAIALAKYNKKVLLIENSTLLGGTNTLSLVSPFMTYHDEFKRTIGGFAQELIDELVRRGKSLGHIDDPLGFASTVTPVDIEGLKSYYFELIDKYNIDLLLDTKVVDVKVDGRKIEAVKVSNKSGTYYIESNIVIDATGDGDVSAMAKNGYTLGRESDNLCQPLTMPFIVKGVDKEKLIDSIKKDKENFVVRDDYDYKYIGISGFFKEVINAKANNDFNISRDRVLLFQNIDDDEVTINMTRVMVKNPLDAVELSNAEREGRRQVKECFNFLKKYIRGFENSYILTTPVRIGVRESRHINCLYTVTKEDVINKTMFSDRIALSSFPMDIHSPNGATLEVEASATTFSIPLRSILPTDIDNLVVTGRAIGATHEACASLRTTPVVLTLGEAAGILSSLSIDLSLDLKDVPYSKLKEELIKNNFIL